MSLILSLFLTFCQVGLFSVGGGYAAVPLIQAQVVDGRAWLTLSEFTDLVTIAEMTPGPIALNAATFVGLRVSGPAGALAATFGCILPSCLIVSLLSCLYRRFRSMSLLQGVLGALRPVVAALIASAAWSIFRLAALGGAWDVDVPGLCLFAGAFILLRSRKLGPIPVMLLCGLARLALALLWGL